MKRTRFPLLVGALMATIFIITGCTADGNGALSSQRLTTGQRAGQALSSDLGSAEPQLEPFDKVVEESKKQFEARLAQEKEPQLEPFDKALEESRKQFEARLAQEEEPQLEPFDRALEESRKQIEVRLAQEREPQLEPFDRALEDSRKQFDLKVAQEKERTESVFSLAR